MGAGWGNKTQSIPKSTQCTSMHINAHQCTSMHKKKLTRFYIHEWNFRVHAQIPTVINRCMAGCSSDGRLWTGLFEKKIKSVLTSEKETLVQRWQFVWFAFTLTQGSNIRRDKWTIQLPTDPSISVFQVFATCWIFVSGICAEMLTSA